MNIVSIHQGPVKPYVKLHVDQLRKLPAQCHFLTDQESREKGNLKIHNISPFIPDLEGFRKDFANVYLHDESYWRFHFERLCFERWFILESFVVSQKIDDEPFVYVDSDTLLFHVPTISPKYPLAGCSGFWWFANGKVLKDYCAFVRDSFSHRSSVWELHRYQQKQTRLEFAIPFNPDNWELADYVLWYGMFIPRKMNWNWFSLTENRDEEGFFYGDEPLQHEQFLQEPKIGGIHFPGSGKDLMTAKRNPFEGERVALKIK